MPQVSQADHVYLKRYLTREKIGYKVYHANPESFEPTQSEFNIDKINKIIDDIDNVKDMVILVSRDNKVIDGHHRWLAFKKTGTKIKVLKINKRYDNVLDILTEFPKTFNKGVNENKEV